ncbi:MAG: hypothetical protein IPP66_03715 [Anaerolineales bacterium]|nr:hypothetical protein [Anaerolineales bacterium]
MDKIIHIFKWVRSNFFYLTFTVFLLLYIWWFRLNPIVFDPGEQANAPLIFGLILLSIYGFIIGLLRFLQNYLFIRVAFFIMAILFLTANSLFVFFCIPQPIASARFGNDTYYVTSNPPFLECCSYYQFTKWEGIFHYESNFFGYHVPQVKFIHDKKTNEVSLVDVSEGFEKLYKTLEKSHQSYEGYAKLENHLYYYSVTCNSSEDWICETRTYMFYQCELDNTSCNALPIEYTTGMNGQGNLQANESSKEIKFYFMSPVSGDDRILILSYGESPACFVDGCSVVR